MRPHRLSRLTFLTQGIALVGFGMTQVGCPGPPMVNGPPPDDLHINAPPMPPPDAAGTPTPSVSPSSAWNDQADAATPVGSQRPIMNAPPPPRDAAAPPMSSQLPTMNAPPHMPPPPPHANAPPKM